MSRLVWDRIEDRIIHNGLDHGVLYPLNGVGIPWNGLTSVEERTAGSQTEPVYYEGERYELNVDKHETSARIKAYTYPPELDELVGYSMDDYGILYGEQEPQYFSFSYRTQVTDGFRIHVMMNQKATAVDATRNTIGPMADALEFVWDCQGVPLFGQEIPASNLIFDTRFVDPGFMESVEDSLYGTEYEDSNFDHFIDLLADIGFSRTGYVITRSTPAEWTILGPNALITTRNGLFRLDEIEADFHDQTDPGTWTIYDDREVRP